MLHPYPTTRDTGPASLIKSVIHLRHCHPFLEVSFMYGSCMKTQTLLLVTGKLRVVSQPCSSKIRTIQEVSQSVSGISIMRNSIVLKGLLAAVAGAVPLLCHAASNVQTGAATSAPGATAHVDFQITIPKILYLRVGTGSSYKTGVLGANGTIDLIQFAP